MKLTKDICSSLRPDHVYGRKGDIVIVIADYGNVYAVQGPDGNKFAVHKDFLNGDPEEVKTEAAPCTAVSETKPIVNKAPVQKRENSKRVKRAAPLNSQQTFF